EYPTVAALAYRKARLPVVVRGASTDEPIPVRSHRPDARQHKLKGGHRSLAFRSSCATLTSSAPNASAMESRWCLRNHPPSTSVPCGTGPDAAAKVPSAPASAAPLPRPDTAG